MRIAAILVAAGSGSRFGADTPKQFLIARRQAGDPPRRRGAGGVRVAAAAGRRRRADRGRAGGHRAPADRRRAAPRGRTACAPGWRRWCRMRPTSCWCTTPPGPASRPAPSLPCWRRWSSIPGAIPALPVADTLKRGARTASSSRRCRATGLFRAQTPQAFRFDALLAAHRRRHPGGDRRRLAAGGRRPDGRHRPGRGRQHQADLSRGPRPAGACHGGQPDPARRHRLRRARAGGRAAR